MLNHYIIKTNGRITAIARKEPIESLKTIINRQKFIKRNARLVQIFS